MAIIIVSLATLLTYQVIKQIERKRSNRKIYNNLALDEEKLMLEAVHQVRREKPTANAIALHYEKLAGKPVELKTVIQRLQEAGEAHLLEEVITGQEDEPILTRKSQVAI